MMNVFLDFDGTLVDIKYRHHKVYTHCVLSHDGTPLGLEEYWSLKRANTPWNKILSLSGVDQLYENDFLQQFIRLIESPRFLFMDQLFEGAMGALDDLSQSYTLHLVSLRRNHESLVEQLQNLSLISYFDTILSGHSDTKEGVLLKKAEVIRTIHGFHNGVIVGDAEADISAGRQLHIQSIAVLSGIRNSSFLSPLDPDYMVDSIVDVTRILR